jgi:uncharacterized SAM-binding protein YcdF (DUF218 family)
MSRWALLLWIVAWTGQFLIYLRERRRTRILAVQLFNIIQETGGRKGVVSYLTMQRAVRALNGALGKTA